MLGKTIIQSGAPDRMYHIMHDGITLVTAFFPIGRGEWTGKPNGQMTNTSNTFSIGRGYTMI